MQTDLHYFNHSKGEFVFVHGEESKGLNVKKGGFMEFYHHFVKGAFYPFVLMQILKACHERVGSSIILIIEC